VNPKINYLISFSIISGLYNLVPIGATTWTIHMVLAHYRTHKSLPSLKRDILVVDQSD
jgi:predicted PurR-regulated permease PerM